MERIYMLPTTLPPTTEHSSLPNRSLEGTPRICLVMKNAPPLLRGPWKTRALNIQNIPPSLTCLSPMKIDSSNKLCSLLSSVRLLGPWSITQLPMCHSCSLHCSSWSRGQTLVHATSGGERESDICFTCFRWFRAGSHTGTHYLIIYSDGFHKLTTNPNFKSP